MVSPEYDAVVVGSGPNGLAAAVTIAEAGASVLVVEGEDTPGGGARTEELTLPGFQHDVCSAIHPLGAASPVFRDLDIEWAHFDVQAAHPLDDGTAGTLVRSVDETGRLNGDLDGWRRVLGPEVEHWDALAQSILGPPLRVPAHPVTFMRFGLRALWPAKAFGAARLHTPQARGLWSGIAAHSITSLDHPLSTAAGLTLGAAAHAVGWPAVKGGSQRVIDALVARLADLGGKLETGRVVARLGDLPSSRVVLFDTTPWQLADIAGSRLPDAYVRRLRRFRHGAASFKVDYALDGPVPWTAEAARRAGTVHLGGTLEEVAHAEGEVAKGRPAERPYVLVAQQDLADPDRVPPGKAALWAYCHVPFGCTVDVSDRIEAQIERFAPGFKERVLARVVRDPRALEAHNPNYIGGDIAAGSAAGFQLIFRPMVSLSPYSTPDPSLFLCSASTPPGAGVHGICGWWAAKAALRSLGLPTPADDELPASA